MTTINQPLAELISSVSSDLLRNDFSLITAESCTGGMIAAELTSISGSSEWFEGAFVTYRLSAKRRMVGVSQETLDDFGAVSEPTAREMAMGALSASDAQVSVSVTGVAGPDGGDPVAPVGTVWFAWAVKNPEPVCVQTSRHDFSGSRDAIRTQAVRIALEGISTILRESD